MLRLACFHTDCADLKPGKILVNGTLHAEKVSNAFTLSSADLPR